MPKATHSIRYSYYVDWVVFLVQLFAGHINVAVVVKEAHKCKNSK